MSTFTGRVVKIGINPCLNVPERVIKELRRTALKRTGPIPVRGSLNGRRFAQTVVKFRGSWRLYLNTGMRHAAKLDVGDKATVGIRFDPMPPPVPMHPALLRALRRNKRAKRVFEQLTPSRRKEILRYLNNLKARDTVDRVVTRVMRQIRG